MLLAAQALGLLDESENLSAEFFAAPLSTLEDTLRVQYRRERLVGALDALLQADAGSSGPDDAATDGGESSRRRYPLLPAGLKGQLYLTAVRGPQADLTLGVEGFFAVQGDVRVQVEVPIVHASGDGADPVLVAGSPQGPVTAGLRVAIGAVTIALGARAW